MSRTRIDKPPRSVAEVPRAQQGDAVAVLRAIKAAGGFSAFEASANDTIARTITRMCHKGYSVVAADGKRTDYGRLIETDLSYGYPHTKVTLTEGGERLLRDAALQPNHESCPNSNFG